MQYHWPDSTYIVIPSYKAVNTLRKLIPALLEYVPSCKLCIVDDASMDGTSQYCNEMNLTYLSHSVNLGKGAALVTGFSWCMKRGAKWIFTVDADGQHAPEDLHQFIDYVEKHPQTGICIGNREKKAGKMPPARIFSNVLTSKIMSFLCKSTILDCQCGYRLYSTEMLKKISITYNRFEMETEVIMKSIKADFPVAFVNIRTVYTDGQSHISHVKDTLRWVKAVLHIRKSIS
ncbi:MAG: glycosyltransferase family 2 protein [Fibrobacter sp.]|nr:glycosyltransferase family 2 protein [Fibrobacter sp.]